MRRLFALAALALLAGCVTPPAPLDGEDAALTEAQTARWDAIRALVGDAPCEAEVGAGTSANMVPLGTLAGPTEHYGEMDVRGDIAVIGAGQALDVVDLSDPREPRLISSLPLEVATADVKWLPGVEGAVIGAYDDALVFVDLTDLAEPRIAGEAPVATQAHMVQPALIDGRTFVYVASQTTNLPAFVYELDGWNATLVGSFGLPAGPIESGPLGNHDITIVHDELLDAPTLYLADGLAGWSAWSLADPVAPERIGGSLGQELGAGYVHTVRIGFFEGKRIVVTVQEVGQNTLKVYDATDLRLPVLLARWNADAARPGIPQHNIQLLGDWLFMAHYTEGVYVFNLTAVVGSPPLLGSLEMTPVAHIAVEDPDTPSALGFANLWDVTVRRGVVYTTDMGGVLTATAFACLAVGDEAASATL